MGQRRRRKIKPISLKHTKYALPAYYIVAPAEASSNLARYDGMRYGARVAGKDLNATYEATRASGFGREVQRRILIGTYVLSAGYYDAYYLRAQKVRQRIAQDFRDAFAEVDAILTPATPSAAFALGEKSGDPVAMYLNDIFTVTANLAGLPALALPAAMDAQGLPLGLQVIGRALDEESVFAVAPRWRKPRISAPKPAKWWAMTPLSPPNSPRLRWRTKDQEARPMHELLERLGRGDTRIIEMCREASRAWADFLEELRPRRHRHALGAAGLFPARLPSSIFESDTLGPNHDAVDRVCGALRHQAGLGRKSAARAATGRGVRAQQLQRAKCARRRAAR